MFYKPKLNKEISQIEFEDRTAYLVLRGTDTKIGGIVKRYNFYTDKPSHIGIAVLDSGQLKIFHVNENLSDRGDNLFHESLQDFVSKDEITYLSIWKLIDFDSEKYNMVYENLLESLKKKYVFDKQIELNNKNYYCSEYVINMIDSPECLIFKKNKIELKGMAKKYLNRDTLIYYPVDGFIRDKNVKKIFEWEKE